MKPPTIDAYLARLSAPQKQALEKLRRAIKAAAPRATECISYDIPGFRLNGRLLVSFGAARNHCAFYPGSHPVKTHRRELTGYSLSTGTIRFPAEKPLPAALVEKLVRTRIEQFATKD